MDLNRIVKDLEAERDRIGRAIAALVQQASAAIGGSTKGTKGKRRRGGLTPAGRRKLSLAMKKRWAARRAKKAKPKASPKKRKGLTTAGRKKLSDAMKKRWAERKKAAAG